MVKKKKNKRWSQVMYLHDWRGHGWQGKQKVRAKKRKTI